MKLKRILSSLGIAAALSMTANAALVNITSVTGHNGGQGFGAETGTLGEQIDQTGLDTSADPSDPSTWTTTGNAWQDEWQSSALLDTGTSANSKIGWTTIDLGSDTAGLENLYVWHNRENNQRYAATYNIYYSTSPTVALPATPVEEQLSADVGASGGAGDYDFSSGGWTQLGGLQNGSHQGNQTIALGGITAQYIAFEIITNNGHADRVGFAEFALTSNPVPEPSSLILLGFGGLALLRRRR